MFPYFILLALLINNVQLPGAKNGILYFVTPVWSKLFEVKVRLLISGMLVKHWYQNPICTSLYWSAYKNKSSHLFLSLKLEVSLLKE